MSESEIRPGTEVLIRARVVDDYQGGPALLVEPLTSDEQVVVHRAHIAEVVEPDLPEEPPDGSLLLLPLPDRRVVLERCDAEAIGDARWQTVDGASVYTWSEVCGDCREEDRVLLYRADDPGIAVLDEGEDPPLTICDTRVEPHPYGVLLDGRPMYAGDADQLGLALIRQARQVLDTEEADAAGKEPVPQIWRSDDPEPGARVTAVQVQGSEWWYSRRSAGGWTLHTEAGSSGPHDWSAVTASGPVIEIPGGAR